MASPRWLHRCRWSPVASALWGILVVILAGYGAGRIPSYPADFASPASQVPNWSTVAWLMGPLVPVSVFTTIT